MPDFDNDSGTVSDDAPAKILFGKYELGKLIGCGAFAKVYHARIILTGQGVAIKCVSKREVLKEGLVVNVKREISIMRRLRHPNIVKLFEVLATKTKIYFVMEFAKGGELFAKVAKGRFSEDLSRRYFRQLISAVGFCHARGVFHRDLKPENLLLDENWDLRVSDFGLSALNDQIRSDGLLHTLCGTPAYVAPEILTKKGYDGAKVDIWSCGIILYVLNAGYLPFNDMNIMNLYRKIYKGEFRCPKFTSPDLRWLISKLLDTNPGTRITIDEILQDPWFNKGNNEMKFESEDFFGSDEKSKSLNAFDIISLSSGYDLTGLFNDPDISISSERFLSAESPAIIRDKIEEVAASTENVTVTVTRKKNWGVKLEEENGDFVVTVEILRLTEKLVMVAIEKRDDKFGPCLETWKFKLRPLLSCLIYQPELPVSGD